MQANDIVLNEVERKSKELTRRKKRSYQLKAALENSDKSLSKEEIGSVQQRSIGRHRLRRKKERRTLRDNTNHAGAVLLWAAVGRTNRLCQTKTKETAKLSLAPNDAVASYGLAGKAENNQRSYETNSLDGKWKLSNNKE